MSSDIPFVHDEDKQDDETKSDDNEQLQHLLQLAKIDDLPYANVTKLNLTATGLSELPLGFEKVFVNLGILFLSQCRFTQIPAVIGACPNLQMVAFKENGMTSIHPDALQPQLRWLILTNNQLSDGLPATIGRCTRLQKLLLSGNQLTRLVEAADADNADVISKLQNLELVRLASNKLEKPPVDLLKLPNLRWIALSDNPFLTDHIDTTIGSTHFHFDPLPILDDLTDISSGTILGTGAGGTTRKVWYEKMNQFVAVKEYRLDVLVTSDGLPAEERRINCAASSLHVPGLIHVYGSTTGESLVMEYLHDFVALAGPPSMESCSRDLYNSELQLLPSQAEIMIEKLLQAMVKLHSIGICHGDFYAHNILISKHDPTDIRLSDFGAAFFYDKNSEYGNLIEGVELQAFETLVQELWQLSNASNSSSSDEGSSSVLDTFLDKIRSDDCCKFEQALVHWQQARLAAMAESFNVEE